MLSYNKRRRPRLLRAFRFVAACAQEAGIARRAVRSQPGCSFLLSTLSRKLLLARCGFATHSCAHKFLFRTLYDLQIWTRNSSLLGAGHHSTSCHGGAYDCRALARPAARAVLEKSTYTSRHVCFGSFCSHTCVLKAFALLAGRFCSASCGSILHPTSAYRRAHPRPGLLPACGS